MSLQHSRLDSIDVCNNQLLIAGRTASELATIAGGTPCYIYDRSALTRRVAEFRREMPKQLRLHYAVKANPMPALVSHLAQLVDGLDVASHRELLLALSSGVAPSQITFAGPGKSIAELRAAVMSGIIINVESVLELARLYDCFSQLHIRPKVALRINPDFELKSSGMKMSGGSGQFGIDAEILPEIITGLHKNKIWFEGFHIFPGSQNLNEDALIECHRQTFQLASRLAEASPMPLRYINIGGGLGIPYFSGEQPLNLARISSNLHELLQARTPKLQASQIVMELGRYLVGESGYYICQITDKKISRGKMYLVTNGGMHHHLANSGNFGQVIRKNYPVVLANRIKSQISEQVEIVGPLCTPLDIVGAKLELPQAKVGDFIVVLQSGAYGASASPQGFLGHPEVIEMLI